MSTHVSCVPRSASKSHPWYSFSVNSTGRFYTSFRWPLNISRNFFHMASVAHDIFFFFFFIFWKPLIWTTLQSFSRKNTAVATCRKRSNNQNAAFLSAIATLFEMGITPDFSKLLAHRLQYGGRMSSLPTYPFQRQRYLSTYDGKVALFILYVIG